MSGDGVEQDPTMEEILQSIKRIIAEDGDEESQEGESVEAASGDEAPQQQVKEDASPEVEKVEAESSPPEEPAIASEEPEKDSPQEDVPAADPTGGDDVLELTDMVRDDGTVVNLNDDDEQGDVLEDIDALATEDAPSAPEEGGDDDMIGISVSDDDMQVEEETQQDESVLEEVMNDDADDAVDVPESDDGEVMLAVEDSPEDAEPMESDEGEAGDASEATEAADEGSDGDFISSDAAGATSAAFQELMDVALDGDEGFASVDSGLTTRKGTTVEELLVEAMRPMLKQWMDDNLPATVERIVKREIQKLIPR